MDEEKKAREQLLALNQVIAQQVLQKRRSLPGGKSLTFLKKHKFMIAFSGSK